jgi:glycosyltransferase involved in cell wall biosynthesis
MLQKKVLIITYYWPPSGGSGVQRWMYFAKYLSEFGVIPTVITVDEKFASYPSKDVSFNDQVKDVRVFKTKTLEPLRFYSFLKSGKTEKVVPQGNVGGSKKGLLDKIATYVRANFFMPDARVGWNRYAYQQVKELISQEHFDLIITTGPPHSTHLVGLKLKHELNIKWMADFRDPWTEVYYNNLFKRTQKNKEKDKAMELSVLNKADLILTVGPSMRELLQNKIPTQKEKVDYIFNGFDEEQFNRLEKVKNDVFTIRYVGTLTNNYPFNTFIESINLLQIDSNAIQIEFIGNIEENVQKQLTEKCRYTVLFQANIPHSEAIQSMKNADLLLLLLPFMEHSKIMLTGKLFEYLATENPILCIGDINADAATIVNQLNQSSAFSKEENTEITRFINNRFNLTPNEKNTHFEIKKFGRKENTRKLAQLIQKHA